MIRDALPGEMYKVFHHYKTDEWERYCATVSDWEPPCRRYGRMSRYSPRSQSETVAQ